MQRYASKLGSCLLNMSTNEDGTASTQLTKQLSELTSLMICMAQGNPKVALKHGLADFYSKQEDQADPNRRKDAFFVDLLVSHWWLSSHCTALRAVCYDPFASAMVGHSAMANDVEHMASCHNVPVIVQSEGIIVYKCMTSVYHVDTIWSCRPAATYRRTSIDTDQQTEAVATICIWQGTQSASRGKAHVLRHMTEHTAIITYRCTALNPQVTCELKMPLTVLLTDTL